MSAGPTFAISPPTALRIPFPEGAPRDRKLFLPKVEVGETLQDRPRLIRAKASTIANLTGLPRPTLFPTTRLPNERHIYSVLASVTLVRSEADQDLHLVLQDGPAHMIAESPTVLACTAKATAYRRKQMADARKVVRVCSKARIVGVAFWNFNHGQPESRRTRSNCTQSSASPASRADGRASSTQTNWPCKSESCSPRLIASRVDACWRPSGFRPGFWPQGQSRQS